MWISNAGFADIFTIFAKCEVNEGKDAGKERLTAFLVERGTPGFTIGKEEHKLGIRGSSTCPLILANCVIPAANLLGEVGKGHHIAFNILNVGRYKLGVAAVGGGAHDPRQRHPLRQGAQGLRQIHLRVRPHPGEDRRLRRRHLRRRGAQLPHRRPHRRCARARSTRTTPPPSRRPSRTTPSSAAS